METDRAKPSFNPALIVVDVQEDFCPPNGSLAVPSGLDTIPIINDLLTLPFSLKVATKDWHPENHISFAANHEGKKEFVDFIEVVNPGNKEEKYMSLLWPVHCVQGTKGAQLHPTLHTQHLTSILEKGTHPDIEMYSAFHDPFTSPPCLDTGLSSMLTSAKITDVYVVGLAYDYCVKSTAIDASRLGFRTWVVQEGTKAVDASKWGEVKVEMENEGVRVVGMEGKEVGMVRDFKGGA